MRTYEPANPDTMNTEDIDAWLASPFEQDEPCAWLKPVMRGSMSRQVVELVSAIAKSVSVLAITTVCWGFQLC